jgi:hypothetical protein
MMRLRKRLFLMTVLSGLLWAQAVLKPVYVESFRKGPTRISEQAMVANLDAQSPNFAVTIKTSEGTDRYQLSIEPHRVGESDDGILSWRVQLIDLRRRYLGNFLVSTKPPGVLTDRPQDRAWWLDPTPYAVVPLLAKRVFKVEDFYCVIQVKDRHFLVPERPLLDSMRVEVQFTETDPRGN